MLGEQAAQRERAKADTILRMKLQARRSSAVQSVVWPPWPNEELGSAGGASAIDEAAAIGLIQLAVRRNVSALRSRKLEEDYPDWWATQRLVATLGGVSASLEARLADYRTHLEPSRELGACVRTWRMATLAMHVIRQLEVSTASAALLPAALEYLMLRVDSAGATQHGGNPARVSPAVVRVVDAAEASLEQTALSLITLSTQAHVLRLRERVRARLARRDAARGRNADADAAADEATRVRGSSLEAVAVEGWFEKLPSKWGDGVQSGESAGGAFDGVEALIDSLSWRRRYVRLLPGRLCWGNSPSDAIERERSIALDETVFATVSSDLTLRVSNAQRTVALRLPSDAILDGITREGGDDVAAGRTWEEAAAATLRTWATQVEQLALGAQVESAYAARQAAELCGVASLLMTEVEQDILTNSEGFAPCAGGGARGKARVQRAALHAAARALMDADAHELLRGFETVGTTAIQTLSKLAMLRLTMEVVDADATEEAEAEDKALAAEAVGRWQPAMAAAQASAGGTRGTWNETAGRDVGASGEHETMALGPARPDPLEGVPLLPALTEACARVLWNFCGGLDLRLSRSIDRMVVLETFNPLHVAAKVTSSAIRSICCSSSRSSWKVRRRFRI